MLDMYIPGFTNMLGGGQRMDMLRDSFDFGGPAYVDMLPDFMPKPVDFAPSTPPAMSVPDMGALNMLLRPDLFGGGPAFMDFMPGAMPEQVSMLPFAPEAPAPQMPQPSMPQPSGLGARQDFMDARDIYIGDAPDRFSQSMNMENYVAPQRDPVTGLLLNAQGQQGFQFMTDRGRQAGFGKGNTGFLTADPNAQYRMFDERGKNRIVAEGTGVEALQNIYNTANQFNTEQGKKANWGIERLNPTTGQWERVAENDPAKNIAGKIADVALPLAGALLVPGLGVVGSKILAAGLGAAGGSALSSVAQGRSLEDTLLRAAISGGASAAGGALGGKIGGALSKATPVAGETAASSLASSALGAGTMGLTGAKIAGLLPEILVTNTAGGALGSAAGSALGAGAGSALGSAPSGALAPSPSPLQQQPVEITPEGEMVLTARPQVGGALPVASAGAGTMANAALNSLPEEVQQLIRNNIQVEQQRQAVQDGFGAGLAAPAAAVVPDFVNEILVQTQRPTSLDNEPALPLVPNIPLEPVFTPDLSPEIVVTDTKPPANAFEDAFSGLASAATAPIINPDNSMVLTGTKPADVSGTRTTAALPFYAGLPIPIPEGVPTTPADVVGEPINIKMDPNAKAKIDAATLASAVTGALPMGGILASGQTPTKGETTLETDKGVLDQLKDRLGNLDAADYLRLAGVLLPLLDGVGGGGRRGALSTIPSGMFGRSSVFSGSLPRATMPSASTGFAPRAPSALGPQTTQDYYRYGYGPAQSFFDYVPQGAANTSRAFTGYEQAQAREDRGFYLGGMAGGGDMSGVSDNSFAVNGPGTGRSDEIPAMLSDGEYVIDAETVALLGDGSSKAGANLLDQFRINVRKDKGRDLVKGDFSANAKRPEHYLKGGRT
jgi:hypothetical protein